ncbi:MAG TPA: hypothetical protein PLE73_05200 [Spirochaetota bacterium]|nr:hypothetical protein [Spirochaetota bacterium]HOS38517.1 hypothetical protein [Spirochaetota bacterium]HPI22570.1 hypothetical protein [Spirochaetota bacterium]HPU89457.1 hypothetical protein [Spirochaetota bacterium]
MRRPIARLGLALLLVALCAGDARAWLFDAGLEARIGEIRARFRERRLMELYVCCVDPRYKLRIEKVVQRMKDDRRTGHAIARRLGFANHAELAAARDAAVVERLFALIVHPPAERVRIDNPDYQRLGLLLSLLFSCFETGMDITGRDVYRDRARVFFSGGRLKMVAYFVFLDGAWYVTEKSLLGNDF